MTQSKNSPKVGDKCKACPSDDGAFLFGYITTIKNDLVYANLTGFTDFDYFVADIPTHQEDGDWILDTF